MTCNVFLAGSLELQCFTAELITYIVCECDAPECIASRAFVFIQARFNPAPVNRIRKICSVWTTTKAYVPYMDKRQDDYVKDTCSSESYGLKPCIIWLDRAALGASFSQIE